MRQQARHLADRMHEATEICVTQFVDQRGQRRGVGPKYRQNLHCSGAELVPGFFCSGDRFTHLAADRLHGDRSSACRSGQQVCQVVGVLDLAHRATAALGVADQIQGIAHQALGDIARTFEEAADLQVDTAAELPGIGVRR